MEKEMIIGEPYCEFDNDIWKWWIQYAYRSGNTLVTSKYCSGNSKEDVVKRMDNIKSSYFEQAKIGEKK